MRIVQVTQPSIEPVTTDALLPLQLRLDSTGEDDLLNLYIPSARKVVESMSHCRLITQQISVYLDNWGQLATPIGWNYALTGSTLYNDAFRHNIIHFPVGPVQSVDLVTYLDSQGNSQTWDPSQFIVSLGNPSRIAPKNNISFPITLFQVDVIRIDLTVGFGDTAADVPPEAIHAILTLVAHSYRQRVPFTPEKLGEVPFGIRSLIDSFSVGNQLVI